MMNHFYLKFFSSSHASLFYFSILKANIVERIQLIELKDRQPIYVFK